MYEGYFSLGGVEVANNARVAAYAGRGSLCACDGFADALGHDEYTTPETDPAPWYDPLDPESGLFGGLFVESIDGLLDAPYDMGTTELAGDGATRARLRASGRVLTVTGWLYAVDRCSAEWGKRWLSSVLAGCETCDGVDFCYFRCCPDDEDDARRNMRTLHRARLVNGPVVDQVARDRAGCARPVPMIRVRFQILTDPHVWRAPVAVVDETVWPVPDGNELCNIEWDTSGECDPSNPDCVPGVNAPGRGCAPNSECPPAPPPPRVPSATTGCACIPLYVVRQCADIPTDQIPRQFTSALRITVYAGEQEVRNLAITVYQNPRQLAPDEIDECRACGHYYIEHIPAESTLVIDGTTSRARMRCPGGVDTPGDRLVFGDGGGPLQHMTLRCGTHYTICADMDTETYSELATLTVEAVTREV